MKHAKKLFSLLLTIVMVAALAVPALAEGETGSGTIRVENAKKGQTYKLYQILTLEQYDSNNNAYLYKVANGWAGFFETGKPGADYIEFDEAGYAHAKDALTESSAATFAQLAEEYAEDTNNNVSVIATHKPDADEDFIFKNDSDNKFPWGYYLVDSTMGVLASLNTTNPNATLREKNSLPTIDKTVQENSTSEWGTTNDASIGETVNFKSKVTVYPNSSNIVIHDNMESGLTYNNDAKIYTDEDCTSELDSQYYTVVSGKKHNECDFEIEIKNSYYANISDATDLYVKYSAVLNENAERYGDSNDNKTWLDYGDNMTTEETPSETKTYTFKFALEKIAKKKEGEAAKQLNGAIFTLTKTGDTSPITFVKDGDDYRTPVSTDDDSKKTTDIVAGHVHIEGLDAGTYTLTETQAPNGYNKLKESITVIIDSSGAITADGFGLTNGTILEVENATGGLLPSTGGIGTTVFYAVGGLCVLAAGVLLVVKKRVHE